MNGTIEVDNSPTTFQYTLQHGIQQLRRIRIFPFLTGVRKPFTDIALPCRPQDGVDHCVQQHIGITVPVESKVGICDMDAANDEWSSRNGAMHIVAFADAQTGRFRFITGHQWFLQRTIQYPSGNLCRST